MCTLRLNYTVYIVPNTFLCAVITGNDLYLTEEIYKAMDEKDYL